MRPSYRRGFIIAVAATLAANFMPPTPTSAADPLTGKLVWMHYDQAQGDSDIWVMNANGTDQHPLTTNALDESNPVWSPDGSKVAFTSTRDGQSDVYVMDEDGTDTVRLTQGTGEFQLGDWSPTANELVATQSTELGQFLVLIDATSGDVTQLRSYDDGYTPGAFSPDGSQILVSLNREEGEGGLDLWTVDHTGDATRLTDTPAPMDEGGATWSPDGSRIAFFANGDVLVMDADGTNVTQLTDDDGFDESPTWSPDSASIAFNTGRADDSGDKWVMNADGSEQRPLVTMFGGEGPADWTTGVIAPLPAPETFSSPILAGEPVSTGDGSEPDVADPTDTTVASPFDGDVTITESDQSTQTPPDDYFFIGQQVSIDVLTDPATTAESPLQITFTLDRSLIPGSVADASEVLAFRDGVLVEPCNPGDGEPAATPDPCVLTAFYSGDFDVTIDVLTSSASDWSFGLAPPFEPPPPPPPESISDEVAPGGTLTTDTEDDGVTPDDLLETTVTTSIEGDAGTVSILEHTNIGIAGEHFTFLGLQSFIEAPEGSAGSPILVEFLIHSSQMPNIPLGELRVLRHGVPVELCEAGAGDAAVPEPCVATQELTGTGDGRIVVRTAEVTGLTWTFGYNLPPQPLLVIESTALESLDHVVLMLSDEIDPTSIPAPSDFRVRVNGSDVTETGVRLLYQGMRGFPLFAESGFGDGVAFLKIAWEEADTLSSQITLSYTPGAQPLQDRSGNETPGFDDLLLERFDPEFNIGFVDDGAGPNHVVLLTAPLDPILPDAGDFTLTLDDEQVLTGTDIHLRHEDLGFGLLDITLDGAPQYSQLATLTYQEGAVPLKRLDGSTVAAFNAEVFVNVSGGSPGFTPPSEEGEPVTVTLHDYLGNGAATLEVTFPSVGEEGGVTTFFSLDPDDVPALTSAFADGAAFYEISTTALFTPPAVICLTYDEGAYEVEGDIVLLHYEEPDWVELDTTVDTDANRACAPVDSFSPFAVAEPASGFEFDGFFKPIDNGGVLNVMSAGRAIPVKFSLGGDQGMNIFAAGSPGSIRVACPSATLDTVETTTSAMANSLSYDAAADQYTFVWKTEKSWSGTCREFRVTFSDGTTETALFKFGK